MVSVGEPRPVRHHAGALAWDGEHSHTPGMPLRVLHINGGIVVRPWDPSPQHQDAQPITERERQVLSLVAEGYSNKMIAHALDITERTVKNHLTLIMTKLRACDRTHAVVTAVRLGWMAI